MSPIHHVHHTEPKLAQGTKPPSPRLTTPIVALTAVLKNAAQETKAIITVEDHFAEGGIGEAVRSALADIQVRMYSLAVRKMPRSGKFEELLHYEEISQDAIIKKVKEIVEEV